MSLRISRNPHKTLDTNDQICLLGRKPDFQLANRSIPRTLGFSNLKNSGKFKIR